MDKEPIERRIRTKAYELWLADGAMEGLQMKTGVRLEKRSRRKSNLSALIANRGRLNPLIVI